MVNTGVYVFQRVECSTCIKYQKKKTSIHIYTPFYTVKGYIHVLPETSRWIFCKHFSFNISAMRIRMDSCSFGTVIFVCILTSVLSEDHCNLIFNMGKYKPFLFHMFVFTVFQFCICTFMHLCISFYPMFILFVIMNYLHVIEIYLCRKCTCSFPCILHHEDL